MSSRLPIRRGQINRIVIGDVDTSGDKERLDDAREQWDKDKERLDVGWHMHSRLIIRGRVRERRRIVDRGRD